MTEELEMLRVYLDSALLMRLADGKDDAVDVDNFRQLLATEKVVALVSFAHLMDMHNGADEPTIARMVKFIDALPCKAYVGDAPTLGERARLDAFLEEREPSAERFDIRLFGFKSLAEVLTPEHVSSLVDLMAFGAKLTAADEQSRLAARLPADRKKDEQALAGVYDAIIRGESPTELVKGMFAKVDWSSLPDETRTILEQLRRDLENAPLDPKITDVFRNNATRFGGTADQLAKVAIRHPRREVVDVEWAAVKGGQERWLKVAQKEAPGTYLDFILRNHKTKDIKRKTRGSDVADGVHVSYLPYVHIATVDAENGHAIKNALPNLGDSRLMFLLPNTEGFRGVNETVHHVLTQLKLL